MTKIITNLPASIRQRLLNLSKEQHRTFEEVLIHYANQRFLFRLCQSPYASLFTLKGAMAIIHLDEHFPRATKDMDFLGHVENSVHALEKIIREICMLKVEPDGLIFDPTSVSGVLIKATEDYPGVRVSFNCHLDTSKVNMQIDIGVADSAIPPAKEELYNSYLDFPAPSILIYQPETILAEKIETLVKKDILNSRVKDVFDIWWIAKICTIDGTSLSLAIKNTFKNRHTNLPERLIIFNDLYPGSIQLKAWQSLIKKIGFGVVVPEMTEVLQQLRPFLIPVMDALYHNIEFTHKWDPEIKWTWK